MGFSIHLGEPGGLSAAQAVGLVNGFLTPESLPPELGRCVSVHEGAHRIEFAPFARLSFGEQPLPFLQPVEVVGNSACLEGGGGMGFLLMASGIRISDLEMDGFSTAIMVNPHGKSISDVRIERCRFRNFTSCCIMTGSDQSGGRISDVLVESCIFEGAPEMRVDGIDDWFDAPTGVMLLAGCGTDEHDVDDCLLERATIRDCIFRGRHRNSINTIPAALGTPGTQSEAVHFSRRCALKGIRIERCSFSGSYDATVNIMGSYMHNVDPVTENVEIVGCHLVYSIWGIYLCATEPCQGTVDGARVSDVRILRNELRLRDGGSGEDSAAIAIQSGRLDYADGARANRGVVEDVRIEGNTIHHTQHGIFLNAADSMVDGLGCEMAGNVIRRVSIRGNRLYQVDDCFTFYGVQLEGRRVDVRIGVPPRTMRWLPLIEDHTVCTCTARGNVIEQVDCRDNLCVGCKFRYKVCGARAGGHGVAEGNRVERLTLQGNRFEEDEGHILVQTQTLWDWAEGRGNRVPSDLQT